MNNLKEKIQISGEIEFQSHTKNNKVSTNHFSKMVIGATLLVGTVMQPGSTTVTKPLTPIVFQSGPVPKSSNSGVRVYATLVNDKSEESKVRTKSSNSQSIGRKIIEGNVIRSNIIVNNIINIHSVDLPMDSVIKNGIFSKNARTIEGNELVRV